MAGRDSEMAAEAKKNGGDALVLSADERDFMGTYSTANAVAISSGNVRDSRWFWNIHAHSSPRGSLLRNQVRQLRRVPIRQMGQYSSPGDLNGHRQLDCRPS